MKNILLLNLIAVSPFVNGLQWEELTHSGNPDVTTVVVNSSRVAGGRSVRRQVYVDLGANWANTLRLYRDIAPPSLNGPWEVYAFEASPFIQPYLEKFTAWLNGLAAKPAVTVPPSGSTRHLSLYASRYGCPTSPDEHMRQCMFQVFKEPLAALKPDPRLADWDLINSRLSMAGQGLGANSHDRYVSVPAAAGARTGTLNLGLMTAEQMIRGGANSSETNRGAQMTVPLVDVVTWLTTNFREEDYVIVKMDIEGAEFPILNTLLDSGHGCLLDKLAWECHHWIGNCNELQQKVNQWSCIEQMTETHTAGSATGYIPWDSESSPDKYYAVDPRSSFRASATVHSSKAPPMRKAFRKHSKGV